MTQLLQNAVYGAGMILAVAVLRRALGGRLIPEARLALWAVCLFRLFTPAAPASVLSFWRLLGRAAREAPAPVPAVAPNAGMPAPAAPDWAVTAAPAPGETGVSWGAALAAVWIAVGLVLAVRYAVSYARTRRAVRRTVPLERGDARYAALPRCARLREGPMDGAPLTFGAVRPEVVLSPGLEGAELVCVLAHEGVHARRRDNLWHYAIAAALTVFWWNPAVWLMARLLRRDVELSCDRAAVKKLGAGRRAEYADALISMATQGKDPAFCQTFGRKAAEERIISVMKYKKMTIIGAALTLALVLAVTVGFASNPGERMPDEDSTASSAPAPIMYACSTSSEGELLKIKISLDYLEESLAEHVADGSMTEQEYAFYLAVAKWLSRDGVSMEWTFTGHSELFSDTDSHEPGFHVYYRDENGGKVFVDPATMLARLFPAPDGRVEVHSQVDLRGELSQETLDWLDWYLSLSEEGQMSVSMVPPELIAGLGLSAGEADAGGMVEPVDPARKVSIDEYKALLDQLVADGKVSRADADSLFSGAKQALEQAEKNGQALVIQTNDTGSYAMMPAPICTLPDCGNTGVHTHDGVTYSSWLGKYSAPPFGCTDEACAGLGPHWHEDGEIIHFYYTYSAAPIGEPGFNYDPRVEDSGEICRLPLAPAESKIPDFVPDYDPRVEDSAGAGDEPIACPPEAIDKNFVLRCSVAGCTAQGEHIHNGVTYACNGAHSGGVCDGNHYAGSTQGSGTHHSENHSSGHHGNGHH